MQIDTSVTEYIEQYKEPFDVDDAINKMMKGSNWPREEYTMENKEAMTREQIKGKWDFDRDDAANRGTYMHCLFEWFLTDPRTMLNITEMRNFLDFYEHYLQPLGATTYQLEWRVFDEDLRIAGSIDYVGKLPDGTCIIGDWKRVKEMKKKGYNGKMMKAPFTALPDSNVGHFCLQLNMYKMLLLRNYGDEDPEVSKMFIAGFHPDCKEIIEVNDLHLGVVEDKIFPNQQL